MSAEFDALKAAFEDYKTDVSTSVATLIASVDKLTAQIAAAPSDTDAIKALTDEVNSAKTALDAAVNPTKPAA